MGFMSGFVFPSLWEQNLLFPNSCPISVLRLVNIASCDQNVWQIQTAFFAIPCQSPKDYT